MIEMTPETTVVQQIKHVGGMWIYFFDEASQKQPRCLCSTEGAPGCSHKDICFVRHGDVVRIHNLESFLKSKTHDIIREIPATVIVTKFQDENFVGKILFEILGNEIAYGPDLQPLPESPS